MCQRCFASCDRYLPELQEATKGIPVRIYVSSFRPFEINISKSNSAGFTRGLKKCSDYEKFSEQEVTFEGLASGVVKSRESIFQFFNPWMLDAQRYIERKKCIRSMIRAMSDVVPFIYEGLPEVLQVRRNKTQISLRDVAQAFENLKKVQGQPSDEITKEIEKVRALAVKAHEALTMPLKEKIQEYDTILESL